MSIEIKKNKSIIMYKEIFVIKRNGKILRSEASLKKAAKLLKSFAYRGCEIETQKKWVKVPTLYVYRENDWFIKATSHHISAGNYDRGSTMEGAKIVAPKNFEVWKVTPQLNDGKLVYRFKFIDEHYAKVERLGLYANVPDSAVAIRNESLYNFDKNQLIAKLAIDEINNVANKAKKIEMKQILSTLKLDVKVAGQIFKKSASPLDIGDDLPEKKAGVTFLVNAVFFNTHKGKRNDLCMLSPEGVTRNEKGYAIAYTNFIYS